MFEEWLSKHKKAFKEDLEKSGSIALKMTKVYYGNGYKVQADMWCTNEKPLGIPCITRIKERTLNFRYF